MSRQFPLYDESPAVRVRYGHGELVLVGEGLYSEWVHTKFGTRHPSIWELTEAFAVRGEVLTPIAQVGLQVPLWERFWTTGASRVMFIGKVKVEFVHAG